MIRNMLVFILSFFVCVTLWAQTPTEHNTTELAKQNQNPVSSLISVPFQFNFNTGGDLDDQTLFILNFQPAIPFKLNSNWNVILRSIVPVVSVPGPQESHFSGMGDIQEQIFISPARPGKLIWGVGPQFSIPTATAAPVETGSWAFGPTFVGLTMHGPWVAGVLINNVWTFTDSGDDTEVNQFLVQPFANYNFGKGWAIVTSPVITANWDAPDGHQWTVPFGIGISRTTVFNRRPMSLSFHYYHNVEHPAGSAANQVRFQISLLYPRM